LFFAQEQVQRLRACLVDEQVPKDVRDVRSLVAGRRRMVGLATRAKNTLHAILHSHQLPPPDVKDIFHPKVREWWEALLLSPLQMTRVLSELDTLAFAIRQRERFEVALGQLAAQDERVPLLVQLPGVGVINAMTILGAIGTIARFPTAQKLSGYAGLGARVHDSGQSSWSGGITKAGRRDLRRALVDAARHAARVKGQWRQRYLRLEKRIGRPKALVAIARKLLVAIWHILTKEEADRHASEQQVACSLFALVYKVGVKNLPEGQTAKGFTRQHMDRLGIGQDLEVIPWGSKRHKLPPSSLD
jgi:transposase